MPGYSLSFFVFIARNIYGGLFYPIITRESKHSSLPWWAISSWQCFYLSFKIWRGKGDRTTFITLILFKGGRIFYTQWISFLDQFPKAVMSPTSVNLNPFQQEAFCNPCVKLQGDTCQDSALFLEINFFFATPGNAETDFTIARSRTSDKLNKRPICLINSL